MISRHLLGGFLLIAMACASVIFGLQPAFATEATNSEGEIVAIPELSETGFAEWKSQFEPEALAAGISQNTVSQIVPQLQFIPKVIDFDRKQPYASSRFPDYRQKIIPASRVKKARTLYHQHKKLLDEIGNHYGVQPRFIVALWAIESNFGENMGNFSIPDALATLAYEGRRAAFFKEELINALRIIDQGHIRADQMKGSWAGAMGQTQFMPSSFLSLAVDYNQDGKKDIWGTKEDVFASIAHYLNSHGWDNNATWGRRVSVPSDTPSTLIGREISKTLPEWQSVGIRKYPDGNLPTKMLTASLVQPDDKTQEYYLVYDNYKRLLKWNRSLYFATGVGLLSDQIN